MNSNPRTEQFPPAGAERVKLLLAKELHREYRAAEKALTAPEPQPGHVLKLRHDHGWDGCHRQSYFIKRAELVIKRAACRAPETLGEAEQALDATILIRRLMVEGQIPFPEADAGERSTDRFSRTVGDAAKPLFAGFDPAAPGPDRTVMYKVGDVTVHKLSDAAQKAVRDRLVHGVLNPSVSYRVNAIAGEGNGRGVR